jgi:hypothetical protein
LPEQVADAAPEMRLPQEEMTGVQNETAGSTKRAYASGTGNIRNRGA